MKVINPLYRDDATANAAYGCKCICNVEFDNNAEGDAGSWWIFIPDCGCACNSTSANSNANDNTAENW